MTFPFPQTSSERFEFGKILENHESFDSDCIRSMDLSRQNMLNALASKPASRETIKEIEPYLKTLHSAIMINDRESIAPVKGLKFKWRSVLSKGIRISLSSSVIEKPMVCNSSIYFEGVNALLAYAYTQANTATKMTECITSSAPGETYLEATKLLIEAAGAFKFILNELLPRWKDKKGTPPECSSEILNMLVSLMIADANRLAITRAQRLKGISPAIWIKLNVDLMQKYEECSNPLKHLTKDIDDELANPFRSYVEDGRILIESQLYKKFAELKHEEGENGLAVAFITQAYNNLLKCAKAEWEPHKKLAQGLLAEYNELSAKLVLANNNITYQRVPEMYEAKAALPRGQSILDTSKLPTPTCLES